MNRSDRKHVRLPRAAALACVVGCYASHALPPSGRLPSEWVDNPDAYASEIVRSVCEELIAMQARTGCPQEDAPYTPEEGLANCVAFGERAAAASCVTEFVSWVDCTYITIATTCEADRGTWPCDDEGEELVDCI